MAERDIIFLVGKDEYGLDVQGITAIESMTDIVPVPNAPVCILGLMHLRGEVIPVYSLRKRFDMEEVTDMAKNKLIVARYNGKSIALKVDEVLGMHDFEESTLSDTPVIAKSARTTYIRAVANKQGKLVLLLEPSGMYEGDEEAQMEEALKKMKEE
ncbi:MAG: purine-binding chemotaxis protein CheW [Lachnospiraceae bacterium]|nr:purine-binding chemotaxis protein CheW [Lachnospiraceae bacterium]